MKEIKIENNKSNLSPFRKIKEITKFMFVTLDRLEGTMLLNINLTDFILKMKNLVIKPVIVLNRKYSKSLTIQNQSINNSVEYKQLKKAEEMYMSTRSSTLLMTVRSLHSHLFLLFICINHFYENKLQKITCLSVFCVLNNHQHISYISAF